jgi:hypothetical protein
MDYRHLLNRAWNVVWEHKFLVVLGMLVALGNGGGAGNLRAEYRVDEADFSQGPWAAMPAALLGFLITFAILLALALWVVSTVARGGLVAGVDAAERGATVTFASAWSVAWQKGWTLLGISVLPAIPVLVLLMAVLPATGVLAALFALSGAEVTLPTLAGFGSLLLALGCIAVPIALLLLLLRTFAERACMLEDLGVLAAYSRGWAVLTQNLGPAVILFLIQIGISIVLAVGLFGPGVIMALCFLLWPVLLLVNGAIAAYFSTLWTLAWREWTATSIPSRLAMSP